MGTRWIPAFSLFLFLALEGPSISRAAVWTVEPDGSGDAPTIQAAVDSAASLDIIELGDGSFLGPGNRDIVVTQSNLVFRSRSGNPESCVIDCQGSEQENHRAFRIAQSCEFHGITIANGYMVGSSTAGRGGAIYSADGVVANVFHCVFADNTARRGGALAYDSSDLAAGASRHGIPPAQVEDCTFLRNHALDNSGAAYFLAIGIDFRGCRFVENTTSGNGGVTSFVNSAPTFAHCLFSGNQAASGGAVACGDPAEFESCTFVGNAATFGSHIDSRFLEGPTTLLRCILAFGIGGSPVQCTNDFGFDTVQASCTDMFGNDGGNWVQCLPDQLGVDGNIELDPVFCDAPAGNYAISTSSPCNPENSDGCGLIGAYGVACQPPHVVARSWGQIKAAYH